MPFILQLLFSLALVCLIGQAPAASQLIEQKAKTHWAFQRVADPPPPDVADSAWPQEMLDRFVLAKLESQGLSPSPPADRRALIRRAYVALTGLQPTYEQTQAFIDDQSPDAFEKVVERLLASPQYGERWARHWLDIARYADTKGYVFQEARQYPYAYTFRDWVIRSLNEDMPYDRFLQLQIAADKLTDTDEDKRHLAAMGFLTVGRRFLNRQADIIDDRIDVVTRGTMALTVACSRCHDHKYDPIPTADYYSLYGVFDSSQEPRELPLLGKRTVTPETEKFERELKAKSAKIDAYLQRRLDDQRSEEQIKKYLIATKDGDAKNDGELKKLASSRGLIQDLLLRWRKHLKKLPADDPIFAPWLACLDLAPENFASEAPARIATSLEHEMLNPRVALALKDKKLDSSADLAAAYAKLLSHDNQPQPYGKPQREQVRLVLHGPGLPNDIPLTRLFHLLPTPDQDKVRKLRRDVEKHKTDAPGAPPRGMVMNDRARPKTPYVFVRGQVGNRGPEVPRQFPAIVAGPDRQPFPADSSGRLEMAKLIADRNNPLTARVIVNRVWLQHFGSALVNTPSDFGLRSDPPSHPQLLDFLAHQFMSEGWSLKNLHRHLLLSATFQQSCSHDTDKASIDPANQLFWKMNRQRLDFESMRDSLIQATGQLDGTMFGRPYAIAKAPFVTRRTIYSEIERQNLESVFRTFDFASPDAHCAQRHETTVPQQALFMMNSPFVESLAAKLASSPSLQTQSPPADKIRYLYRRIFARDPDSHELGIGIDFTSQPAPPGASATPWRYGYGSYTKRLVDFQPLPRFTGTAYQGGESLPDPTTGWVHLNKDGGHPGHGQHYHAILRFTAPESGNYNIDCPVSLPAQMSDGITVSIVARGREELANQEISSQGKHRFHLQKLQLQAGDTLDLIVACGRSDSHDSFRWNPSINSEHQTWSYRDEFSSPKQVPSRWQQYVQALLSSNQFVFID